MYQLEKITGAIALLLSLLFFIVVLISEGIIPKFNPLVNVISDLGVGSTASLFNTMMIVVGIGAIIVSGLIFFNKELFTSGKTKTIFSIAFFIFGIGALGVGIFPKSIKLYHAIFAFIAFSMEPIITLLSYKLVKKPFRNIFAIIGVFIVLVGVLFALGVFKSVGFQVGLIERLYVYPFFLWTLLFGVYLIKKKQ